VLVVCLVGVRLGKQISMLGLPSGLVLVVCLVGVVL